MKAKAKFKLNDGDPVLLCSQCNIILKYSRHFTEEEWKASKGELKMIPQFCYECEEKKQKQKEWVK